MLLFMVLGIKDDRNNDLIYAKQFRADSDWLSILKTGNLDNLIFYVDAFEVDVKSGDL